LDSAQVASIPKYTIPLHDPLRIGTLASILADVAQAHTLSREMLLGMLFE
jgi:hypothetical protein